MWASQLSPAPTSSNGWRLGVVQRGTSERRTYQPAAQISRVPVRRRAPRRGEGSGRSSPRSSSSLDPAVVIGRRTRRPRGTSKGRLTRMRRARPGYKTQSVSIRRRTRGQRRRARVCRPGEQLGLDRSLINLASPGSWYPRRPVPGTPADPGRRQWYGVRGNHAAQHEPRPMEEPEGRTMEQRLPGYNRLNLGAFECDTVAPVPG